MKAWDYVFPVVGGKKQADSDLVHVVDICGTAFSIGGNLFLTAYHVLESAVAHDDFGLGYVNQDALHRRAVLESHSLPELDLAVVRSPVPEARALRWQAEQLQMLADVQTAGFPYALDTASYVFTLRAFKGYVVSNGKFARLAPQPRCYELSFQAPRGLSGAPVWSPDGTPTVRGVVLGNQSTEMLVFSARERLSEQSEKIVERFEAMQTGLALQSSALLDIRTRFFEGTLADHLSRQGLL